MKAVFKKLKSKAGESLVETLAAILIFTMASIVMYTMVSTAADINTTVKEKDKVNQEHMLAIEKGEPDAKSGSGTVYIYVGEEAAGQEKASIKVDIYGGHDDSLYAYYSQTK